MIRQRCTEITHITAHEVLDRSGYPQLGRIMLSGVDLGAFIEDEVNEGDDNEEEEEEEDGDGNADEESETLGDLARRDNGVTYVVLPDEEPLVAVPAPTVPLPGPHPDTSPDPRTWRALGEGYQNFIALVQSSYQHPANLQNAHITSTSGQLAPTQRSNENIVGERTKLKIGVFEAESSLRGDDGEGRVREELGKQFIAELGGLGRVLATAKFGLAPEMIELAEIVNASPELLEAMKNPAVKKILRDEKTRKELAALLVMAAQAGDAPANDAETQPNGQSAAA